MKKYIIFLFFILFTCCNCVAIPSYTTQILIPKHLPKVLKPQNNEFVYRGVIIISNNLEENSVSIYIPLITDYSLTCVDICLKTVCIKDSANMLCVRECLTFYPCQLDIIEQGDWENSNLQLFDLNSLIDNK